MASIEPPNRCFSGVPARTCPDLGRYAAVGELRVRQDLLSVKGRLATEFAPVNSSFFGDMLQTIADRGRALMARDRRPPSEQRSADLVDLCDELLSGRGEASGVALASEILARYGELTSGARIAFFESLASKFGPDHERLAAAIETWRAKPSDVTAAGVHVAAEPRRQELLRRLNLAPGGTAMLVRMREQLLDALTRRDDLKAIDRDFVHMFQSWFNRGFLVLRRIDW